ncbi:MAG: alpha-ketoglutarate-dependent dioxygenase AlkB [Myxococcota bacterium]|nr:alpha-ketoglutarate-dependent dioxygenase AlkB [Myxococcota bacterium]
MLALQLPLFAAPDLSLAPDWSGLRHIPLGACSWLEHHSGWLRGHGVLFEQLRQTLAWRAQERPMYERVVAVPRLLARLPQDGPVPSILERCALQLSQRYGRPLYSLGACLYRDGRDSVAWHGDRLSRSGQRVDSSDRVIAILSLGEPRRFLIRPSSGGPSRAFELGWGDLLVMGGRCQEDFEHCVPKVASALPRISVQFRPGPPELLRGLGQPSDSGQTAAQVTGATFGLIEGEGDDD